MVKLFYISLLIFIFSSNVYGGFLNDSDITPISSNNDVVRYYEGFYLIDGYSFVGTSKEGKISTNYTGNYTEDTSTFAYSNQTTNYPRLKWFYTLSIKDWIPFIYVPTYIVEYVENNKKPGLQIDEDEIVRTINLATLEFQYEIESGELENSDGMKFKVYHISVASSTGLFQINYTISENPIKINGTLLSSSQSKIDIGIYNYYNHTFPCYPTSCYSGPSNKNSNLALLSFLVARSGMEVLEEKVSVNNDLGLSVNFEWAKTANIQVENSSLNEIKCVYTNSSGYNAKKYGSTFIKEYIDDTYVFLVTSFEGSRPSKIKWDTIMGGSALGFNNISSKCIYNPLLIAIAFLLLLV
ncbi:hypothetical protein DICPUDRAFT_82644 [Dictyostelium purpureum]|uniref:Uncharacterized protein n=1 Tax=Dictyostelium purpureum TaxID=5786 RepID=F0ZX50_DICPU|nr:uncharacterized protein DICPUDRAFT_82644 [Dictyostelium purpureum]EGC31491.1 hypothetical protein DICPUDRAFT_82644 [Dictyostelium purpureum]|eukprot:XP_003291996.1 hypothetical protein DICPUDRAFT_82644 [Dictyostelium purpureum]